MRLSIFPLQGAVLYPGLQLPLHVFEPRYRAMVGDALARDRRIAADIAYKLLTIVSWIKHHPDAPRVVTTFQGGEFLVSMTFVGDVSGMFVVSASRPAALSIARALLNQDDVEKLSHEAVMDAVKEFANVICGSIVAKAVSIGKKVDIVPPDELPVEADRSVQIPEDMVGLFLPLVVASDSAIDFALFMNH